MTTIHVELDDATYEKARRAAQAAGRTVEQLAAEAITERAKSTHLGGKLPAAEDIIGLFNDDPEGVDAMLEAAMQWRRDRNNARRDEAPPMTSCRGAAEHPGHGHPVRGAAWA